MIVPHLTTSTLAHRSAANYHLYTIYPHKNYPSLIGLSRLTTDQFKCFHFLNSHLGHHKFDIIFRIVNGQNLTETHQNFVKLKQDDVLYVPLAQLKRAKYFY